MLRKILIIICFFSLLMGKAQSAMAFNFADTKSQQAQKDGGKDGEDDNDDSGGGGDSGSGGDDSGDDGGSGDNSGSGNDNDNSDDNGNSGSDNDSDDGDSDGGNSGNGDDNGNNDDNGNSSSGGDDDGDNSGNGNGNNGDEGDNGGNNGNGNNGNGNDDDDDSGKGKDEDDSGQDSGNDNSGKGNNDDEPERRYYVGAVSASDGKSVLISGSRLESNSPWLEVLSTGVWFEAYGYWQGNSFIAENIKILDDEAWSYFRGPASVIGVRAKGNVEVWTKTSGVDTRLTSEEQVRLVAYFDGSQYRSLPGGLTPPTTNVPTGWVELTGSYDGQNIVWGEARAFP